MFKDPKRKRLILYVLAGISLAFLVLTILVLRSPVLAFDGEFTREIQEYQHPLLDELMIFISWFGFVPQSILLPLAASLIFYIYKRKREALFIAFTLFSGVISRGLKILIDRPRPTEDLVQIIETAKYQSFPSGHVLLYVIFFGFMIVLMARLKEIVSAVRVMVIIISSFFILTIPFSRIYLGAHWLTDVVGSILLGILLLYVLSYFYLKED